jgi:glycosyltransferase involved in cell wall biosynthesis
MSPQTKRPLKIAIISQYFWPEVFPINQMAEALAARGHEIEVLTGQPNYPAGKFFDGYGPYGPWCEVRNNMTIKRVPQFSRGSTRLGMAANYLSFAISSLFLSLFRLRGDYDVILTNQPSPLLGVVGAFPHVLLRRKPMVLWVQDLWPESLEIAGFNSRPAWKAMDWLMRLTYRLSDTVFVQSRAFADHAGRYGVPAKRILYVPNWADAQYRLVSLEEAETEDAEMPKGVRFVFAGNIGEAQCIPTLVEAATLLKGHPNIRIIVIGDGRMRPWLETEIVRRQLGQTLTYIGHRPGERMPHYFAASDALLLTLRKNDTMAHTIPSRLQAFLACGRPVIAALDGEARRIVIESGSGIGAEAENAASLRDAMLSFAALDDFERLAMAQASAACSLAEFDAGHIVDRVEEALHQIADRNAAAA